VPVNALPLRAAALGAATGGRSMTGLAAVALTTAPDGNSGWFARLAGPWGRRLTVAAALGEITADKFPRVPSRLAPPALAGRLVTGCVAAWALARRHGARPAVPVLVATGAVLAGSLAGARWRAYAQRRGWPVVAAIAEDAVVVALATTACAQRQSGLPPATSWSSRQASARASTTA
jgi:uncharacterized membrane protein